MSRTLKRPMFRRGGPANNGIMTGLTDREKFSTQGTLLDVDRARLESKAIQDIMNELAPIRKTRAPLGTIGFALATGEDPIDALGLGYRDFVKRDDARRALIDKRKQAAVSTALGSQLSTKGKSKIALEKMIDLSIKAGEFPDTPEGRNAAFKKYSLSASDIERASIAERIDRRFNQISRSGGTEQEAQYDILSGEGKIKIEGTDFGKKSLGTRADREDITDNENFGPDDGFFDIDSGKYYVLKPGGNKESFTAENYEIIDLKSLY